MEEQYNTYYLEYSCFKKTGGQHHPLHLLAKCTISNHVPLFVKQTLNAKQT